MTDKTPVLLHPRDPLIFRDARPFGADPGARAFGLAWPLPRSIAGGIRTHVINASSTGPVDWQDRAAAQAALAVAVHGPLLAARLPGSEEWRPYVPAPKDLIPYRTESDAKGLQIMPLRPVELPAGGGCDFPETGSPPIGAKDSWDEAMKRVKLRPLGVTEDVKPAKTAAFWSLDQATTWLAGGDVALREDKKTSLMQIDGLDPLPGQTQVHVAIDPETRIAREGKLFTTDARAFRDDAMSETEPALAMLCQITTPNVWNAGDAVLPLGGERRMVHLSTNAIAWPDPPHLPSPAAGAPFRLRLQLVTPAIFTHGWLPGWMVDGIPPGLGGSKLELNLAGVASDRRVAVSGWRLASRQTSQRHPQPLPPGPKATLYAVPAGSVYFFEIKRGEINDEIWRNLWLLPVSDQQAHRDEGFGLVLPGIW